MTLATYAKAALHKPKSLTTGIPVLPNITLSKTCKINAEHVGHYNALSEWDNVQTKRVHPSYIQTLSLSLQLEMMVMETFPFKPMGLVHLANKIDTICLPEHSATLQINTHFGTVFWHKLGWVFELHTLARVEQELVVKATSYYLARVPHTCSMDDDINVNRSRWPTEPDWLRHSTAKSSVDTKDSAVDSGTTAGEHDITLDFATNIGRQYAKVSGDYNPIHLYPITARIFGFKKAIAHGMLSKARVISNLAQKYKFTDTPFDVACSFLKPISLPAHTNLKYELKQNDASVSQMSFNLRSGDHTKRRIHLAGSINLGNHLKTIY